MPSETAMPPAGMGVIGAGYRGAVFGTMEFCKGLLGEQVRSCQGGERVRGCSSVLIFRAPAEVVTDDLHVFRPI